MRNGVLKAGGTIKYPGIMALMSATTVIFTRKTNYL